MSDATHSEPGTEITESDRSHTVIGSRCVNGDCQCASTQREACRSEHDAPCVKCTVREPGYPVLGARVGGSTPDPGVRGARDRQDLPPKSAHVFELDLINDPGSVNRVLQNAISHFLVYGYVGIELIGAPRTGYDGPGDRDGASDPAPLPPGAPFFYQP